MRKSAHLSKRYFKEQLNAIKRSVVEVTICLLQNIQTGQNAGNPKYC